MFFGIPCSWWGAYDIIAKWVISASADGGPRSQVCERRNFPAHMSVESPSNVSPNPFEVVFEVSEP